MDENGRYRVRWIPQRHVKGIAHDTPILGHRVNTANLLRLWSAEAVNSFDFESFNTGDYYGAVEEKVASETISKVLYPNDSGLEGKQLRLEQQYFFVSATLQDIIRRYSGEWSAERFIKTYLVNDRSIMDQLRSDPKRTVTTPANGELEAGSVAFKAVLDEWVGKDERRRTLLQMVKAEIAKLRAAE